MGRVRWPQDTYKDIIPEDEFRAASVEILKDMLENKSSMFSSEVVSRFEQKFSERCGCKYSVVVSSGSAALTLAVNAMRILNPKRKYVVIPAYAYIANLDAVVSAGLKPIFVDVNPHTAEIDVEHLSAVLSRIGNQILAVEVIHPFGKIHQEIKSIVKEVHSYGAFAIEDASQAHLGAPKHGKAGKLGDVSVHSLMQNKIIRAGEGGIISTDDKDIYETLTTLRSHGEIFSEFTPNGLKKVKYITLNSSAYRPQPFGIYYALLCLKHAKKIIDTYNRNGNMLLDFIEEIREIQYGTRKKGEIWWHFPIVFESSRKRDFVLATLLNMGILAGLHFPANLERIYSGHSRTSGAETFANNHIILPTYPALSEEHMQHIGIALRRAVRAQNPDLSVLSRPIRKLISGMFIQV